MTEGWSHAVTTRPPSTFGSKGMYTKDAITQYLEMRLPNISPNGLGSAIMMQVFFVNRAGRSLSKERRDEILGSSLLLRVELQHLKWHHSQEVPRNEDKIEALLQNDFHFELMKREFRLAWKPKPVYPPPPKDQWIGGKNGYNRKV